MGINIRKFISLNLSDIYSQKLLDQMLKNLQQIHLKLLQKV